MIKKKKIIPIIQFFLLIIGLALIYFTYYHDKTTPKVETKKTIQIENNREKNIFEDVEYRGVDLNGNSFLIKSEKAEFEVDKPELIKMEIMTAFFYFKDDTVLEVRGKYGTYNNKTFDIEFRDDIKAKYENYLLLADNLDYTNTKNLLLIYGNVKSSGEKGEISADKLNFDLKKETLDISMFDNQQIDVKLKNQ